MFASFLPCVFPLLLAQAQNVCLNCCLSTPLLVSFVFILILDYSESPRADLHVVGMLRFMFLTWTNRAGPLLFILFFCLFLSSWPFNCISFHKFSRQLSAFSLYSSGLISALLVLSTMCLFFRKVSRSPDIILCGWPGLKHQLTD